MGIVIVFQMLKVKFEVKCECFLVLTFNLYSIFLEIES